MNDIINAMFELLAGFFVALHCLKLFKDKQVRGASIWATSFFTLWGFWNIYYYPSLDQWWSMFGGIAVVTMNIVWVGLMWKYRNN